MKQPRLPGAEKFRFSTPLKDPPASITLCHNSDSSHLSTPERSPNILRHSRAISRCSQSELSPLTCTLSVQSLHRNDSRRRPVLPITCKKTSRMLTNTNLELNVDHAELVTEECVTSRLATPNRVNLDNSRVPSCPNLESSRSLNSSKTSLDTYFRKMSLQTPTIRESPNVDWMNIRASPSRLSASCSSSCSSEENVWVLRGDES